MRKYSAIAPQLILTFCFCTLISGLHAQILRGTVRDAENGEAITGATVAVYKAQGNVEPTSLATNPNGDFSFESLKPGYYRCEISAVGFQQQTIAEIAVAAGKDQTLDISLNKTSTLLADVTVSATRFGARTTQPLSEISLTRDQTLRFPSMYFDPGRLAAAYPGVVQTDDGINGMSIRGNNPSAVRWRIDGVDVVNPNHLPNAGTFGDRAVAAGGGVLMFSAQLLDNSSLLTGNYSASMGDALGGIMDMNLRKGNNRRQEFTAQAGLVGLDLAAEGPLSKKENAPSYLANYRYSTVGLLGQLGVSFGDEQINFQDFSFNTFFPGKKGGGISVFGMGGLSENVFTHKADSSEIKLNKDRFDINFNSKTGIAGVNGLVKLGAKTWLKPSLTISGQENNRDATLGSSASVSDKDHSTEMRVNGVLALQHHFYSRLKLYTGLNISQINYTLEKQQVVFDTSIISREKPLQTQLGWAWAQLDWRSNSDRWSAQAGLNYTLHFLDNQGAALPKLTLSYRADKRNLISLAYGLQAQTQPLWVYVVDPSGNGTSPNSGLGLSKSRQLGLRHTWSNNTGWSVKTELYSQYLYDVPVSANAANPTFSILNFNEVMRNAGVLSATGSGRNQGVECTVERYLQNGWFGLANISLFDSKYRGNDGVWRDTRWNSRHILNLVGGKEWQWEKSGDKFKAFGANGRLVWTGGFRAMPVDLTASRNSLTQETVFDASQGFSEQFPDYYRVDIRVYWKRSLGNRRNSTFAMDFQNITLQKNIAYYYFDPLTDQVETKYQLELIPNVSWRLEF